MLVRRAIILTRIAPWRPLRSPVDVARGFRWARQGPLLSSFRAHVERDKIKHRWKVSRRVLLGATVLGMVVISIVYKQIVASFNRLCHIVYNERGNLDNLDEAMAQYIKLMSCFLSPPLLGSLLGRDTLEDLEMFRGVHSEDQKSMEMLHDIMRETCSAVYALFPEPVDGAMLVPLSGLWPKVVDIWFASLARLLELYAGVYRSNPLSRPQLAEISNSGAWYETVD